MTLYQNWFPLQPPSAGFMRQTTLYTLTPHCAAGNAHFSSLQRVLCLRHSELEKHTCKKKPHVFHVLGPDGPHMKPSGNPELGVR